MIEERYNLAWNEFDKSTNLAFRNLLLDTEFADVTIACDDDKQITAHKVILSACSPFFRNILLRNPHQKPLLYLRGLKHEDIEAILRFMYLGQTEVNQSNLEHFLTAAKDLEVKGLNESLSKSGSPLAFNQNKPESKFKPHEEQYGFNESSFDKVQFGTDEVQARQSGVQQKPIEIQTLDSYHLENDNSDWDNSNIVDTIDEEEGGIYNLGYPVDSLTNDNSYVQNKDGKYPCGQCDYQPGTKTLLRRHQQSKHQGVKFPCDRCDRKFSSPDGLRVHIYQHEGKTFPCNSCEAVFPSPPQLSTHKSKNHKY